MSIIIKNFRFLKMKLDKKLLNEHFEKTTNITTIDIKEKEKN